MISLLKVKTLNLLTLHLSAALLPALTFDTYLIQSYNH